MAATAKTVIELTAAANHRSHIEVVSFFFDGKVVTDEPVVVEMLDVGTTGTGTAGTEEKVNRGDGEAIQTSFKYNFTVEPTGLTVLKRWNIHPQTGYERELPITRPIPIAGSDLWALRFTAPQAVNVIVNLEGNE